MRYIKWIFLGTIATLVFGFLNYTLPDRDVVRIVETEVRRVDFGANSVFWAQPDAGQATGQTSRDVRFINTVTSGGKVMVYRNEDTGWGWPPYFKLDSSNLQTKAADLVSTSAAPQWVVMRHYGWRTDLLSIFPNAVSLRPIDSPDVQLIPWFNIVLLAGILAFFVWLWRLWDRFHERRIEPIVDDIAIAIDHADRRADSMRERFWAWIGRRTGRKPK